MGKGLNNTTITQRKISMTLSSDTIIQRNDSVIFSDIDDQVVMMDLDNGDYFELNTVGTRIWELLETPTTVNDLVKTLLSEFDIAEDVCRTETEAFINNMLRLQTLTTEQAA